MDRLPERGAPDLSGRVAPAGRRGVLLVTGAWFPEPAGGSLQARALAHACRQRVHLRVIATSRRPDLPARAVDGGIGVQRVVVDPVSSASLAAAAVRLASAAWAWRREIAVVHLVGYSRKTALVAALASALGQRLVLKLTSAGADDPVALAARGRLADWSVRRADALVAPSPALRQLALDAGIDAARVRLIPNGVDLERFRPASPAVRAAARAALGLPAEGPLALCVGHFAPDKGQDVLLEAWARGPGRSGVLAFAGATSSSNREVDAAFAGSVRAAAARLGLADRVFFLGHREDVAECYRAADLFAFASRREGQPNAVLEALACALPSAVVRLPGITDALVADGESGLLAEPGDALGLARALARLAAEPALRERLGAGALAVARAHSLAASADAHCALWRELGAELSS